MREELLNITLTEEQLWEAIYASRDAEKYWRQTRRLVVEDPRVSPYSYDELTQKLTDQKQITKSLETLAPAHTW